MHRIGTVRFVPRPPRDPKRLEGSRVIVHPLTPDERATPDEVCAFLIDLDRTQDGWHATGTIRRAAGRLVIGAVTFAPKRELPVNGLTTEVLRRLRTAEVLGAVQRTVSEMPALYAEWRAYLNEALPAQEEPAAATATAGAVDRRKPGPKPFPDEESRWVAETYLRLVSEGWTRGIHAEIAKGLSKRRGRPVQWQTARDAVSRARKREFLAGGTQGKAAYRPGPKLLKEWEEQQ